MPANEPSFQILKRALGARSPKWLVRKTGLSFHRIETILAGDKLTTKAARKIEVALGRAIWTAPEQFRRMQAAAAWLALPVDPFIHCMPDLIGILRSKGIFVSTFKPQRAQITAAIFAAYDKAHTKTKARK